MNCASQPQVLPPKRSAFFPNSQRTDGTQQAVNSEPELSSRNNGIIVEPFRFPATKHILWDRKSQGDCETLHLVSRRNLRVMMNEKTLQLAVRHLNQSSSPFDCFLVGSLSVDSREEAVDVSIDRFDPGREIMEKNGKDGIKRKVPTTVVPGDHIIPITLIKGLTGADNSVTHSKAEFQRTLSVLYSRVSGQDTLNLSSFLSLKACCHAHTDDDEVILNLHIGAITMVTTILATPVAAVPIIPTALARNLTGPLRLSDVHGTPKYGFLTMDHTRKLLLLLGSDPKAFSLPLIGIWVSGTFTVMHPYIWACCLRFINCTAIRERVLAPPNTFLLVHYSPAHTMPIFWECTPQEQMKPGPFELFSCYENLHLEVPLGARHSEPLCFDLLPSGDNMNMALFNQAVNSWTNKQIESTSASKDGSPSIPQHSQADHHDGNIMPRPSPSPHPQMRQNPLLMPTVPEVSLSLSFEESFPEQEQQVLRTKKPSNGRNNVRGNHQPKSKHGHKGIQPNNPGLYSKGQEEATSDEGRSFPNQRKHTSKACRAHNSEREGSKQVKASGPNFIPNQENRDLLYDPRQSGKQVLTGLRRNSPQREPLKPILDQNQRVSTQSERHQLHSHTSVPPNPKGPFPPQSVQMGPNCNDVFPNKASVGGHVNVPTGNGAAVVNDQQNGARRGGGPSRGRGRGNCVAHQRGQGRTPSPRIQNQNHPLRQQQISNSTRESIDKQESSDRNVPSLNISQGLNNQEKDECFRQENSSLKYNAHQEDVKAAGQTPVQQISKVTTDHEVVVQECYLRPFGSKKGQQVEQYKSINEEQMVMDTRKYSPTESNFIDSGVGESSINWAENDDTQGKDSILNQQFVQSGDCLIIGDVPSVQRVSSVSDMASRPDPYELLMRQEQQLKELQDQIKLLLLQQQSSTHPSPVSILTPPRTPVTPADTSDQPITSTTPVTKITMCTNTGASLMLSSPIIPRGKKSARTSPMRDVKGTTGTHWSKKQSSNSSHKLSQEETVTQTSNNTLGSPGSSPRPHKLEDSMPSPPSEEDPGISSPSHLTLNADEGLAGGNLIPHDDPNHTLASSIHAVDFHSYIGSPEATNGRMEKASFCSPVLGESASILVQDGQEREKNLKDSRDISERDTLQVEQHYDSMLYRNERLFYDNLLAKARELLCQQVEEQKNAPNSSHTALHPGSDEKATPTIHEPTREEVVMATVKELERIKNGNRQSLDSSSTLATGETIYYHHPLIHRSTSLNAIPDHPCINYVSLCVDETMDEVFSESDSLALKYLTSDQLQELRHVTSVQHGNRISSRAVRFGSLPERGGSLGSVKKSEVDYTWNNLSMATQNYLEKYHLAGSRESGNRRKSSGLEVDNSVFGDRSRVQGSENGGSPSMQCLAPPPTPEPKPASTQSNILDIQRLKKLPKLF